MFHRVLGIIGGMMLVVFGVVPMTAALAFFPDPSHTWTVHQKVENSVTKYYWVLTSTQCQTLLPALPLEDPLANDTVGRTLPQRCLPAPSPIVETTDVVFDVPYNSEGIVDRSKDKVKKKKVDGRAGKPVAPTATIRMKVRVPETGGATETIRTFGVKLGGESSLRWYTVRFAHQ